MTDLEKIGKDLSEIINQDGDDISDGEVVDQIIDYLKSKNIYTERIW